VVFHPNNSTFMSYELEDQQDFIKNMLATRKQAQISEPTNDVPDDVMAMFSK